MTGAPAAIELLLDSLFILEIFVASGWPMHLRMLCVKVEVAKGLLAQGARLRQWPPLDRQPRKGLHAGIILVPK